ncbi:MAG: extracellular solute-binding protein [Betaproteobacteria bacterium]|nr:extracellular solute-binding protein [Betaproteobacteria bacterium]
MKSESIETELNTTEKVAPFAFARSFRTGCITLLFLISNSTHAQEPGKIPLENSSWTAVVAAAQKEGAVSLYSAQVVPVIERLVASFKAKYPAISVEYFRGTSSQISARVDQERASASAGADAVISSEFAWFDARTKDGSLVKPAGPASRDWPQQFMIGDSVLGGLEPFVIPYNKTLMAVPPKGYADLLKPEFKGKIGTPELAAVTLVAWYDWLEKTQGNDFLGKLKAQSPKLYVSAPPLTQALAAGEIIIGTYTLPTAIRPLIEQGAPIDYAVPTPGFGTGYSMAVLRVSKRPNAAVVLVDYIMSPEGQSVWHGRGETASPRPNIKGSLPVSSITLWPWNKYPADVVKSYTEHWNKVLK